MIEGLYVALLSQKMQTGMIPHSEREGVGKWDDLKSRRTRSGLFVSKYWLDFPILCNYTVKGAKYLGGKHMKYQIAPVCFKE